MGNCPPLPSQDPDQIPVNPERWRPKPWLQNEFTKSSQAETPMNHCQSNQLSALPTPRSPFETKLLLKFLEKQTCLQLKHVTQPFFLSEPVASAGLRFLSLTRGPAGNQTTTSSLSATQECRDANFTTRWSASETQDRRPAERQRARKKKRIPTSPRGRLKGVTTART